ncbi:MAG: DUF3793 family protein [Ruminiclostridium sp.]|nr:DUF3793 family protein [Ruminiclostridium sp.]
MYNKLCNDFIKKIAFHTAPTLLGIKCASLVSLAMDDSELYSESNNFNTRVEVKGIKSRVLCNCKSRSLLLVYNEKQLSERLADKDAERILSLCGYPTDCDIDAYISFLSRRIRESEDFPHEIGIFLGYPIEDVEGFIKNKGENFKLCGYWKVYGCPEKARCIFNNYEKCRRFLCNRLNEGVDLYQALKIS